MHVHCSASFDCKVEPERVFSRCRELGLTPVFLTDHNTVDGAMRIRDRGPVVVGEEVMTEQGELIGLFLSEAIPAGLSADDAVRRIKAQGGLVYLEHPYDPFRRHLDEETIESLAGSIDVVEVWNGRSDRGLNREAEQLCAALDAAAGAGSDAHRLGEIGSVYVEMEEFNGPQDFLVKLRRGKIHARPRRFGLRRA